MNSVAQSPKQYVSQLKYLYKLFYIEENDTLWAAQQNAKTKEWGEWEMISEGFLYGEKNET